MLRGSQRFQAIATWADEEMPDVVRATFGGETHHILVVGFLQTDVQAMQS